jgi:hypothetical protein
VAGLSARAVVQGLANTSVPCLPVYPRSFRGKCAPLGESWAHEGAAPGRPRRSSPPPIAVDAAIGAAAVATTAALWVVRRFARAAALVGRIVTHPPLLTERLHPARVVEALADRGHAARTSTGADLNQIIAAVVPPVVYEVLDNLDLTELVLERVDIDTLVSAVDVEAIVDRVDIAAIVERLDIDAIVSNVDIDAIVRKMNIDAIASQLDIDAIVSRLDVDAIA